MPVTMKELGLDKLSAEDRELLAHELLDSVEEVRSSRLSDAQKAELDRRLQHLEAHPEDVVSWEEVKAGVRARYGR